MPLFPFSPWTDMYKMKLDFILSEAKKLKEYVAASSASATAAAASADDAEASADDAALSATQAAGSAQDAAESATQAAGSADDAADSADSAASAAADAVAPISSLVNTLDNAVTVMQSQMAAFINSHSGTRDETLLWSAPTLADGLHYIGQTCVLSESPDSFDYIIVNYENSGSAEVHPAKTADLIDPYKGVTIYSPALDTSGAHMILKGITIACNDNTDHTNYIVSSAKQIYWDGIAANAAIEYVSSTSSHYYAGTITSIIGVKYLADAEVADIRVGADGTIYPTAGDAVRGQVSDLKSHFDNKTGVIEINGNQIPYYVNSVVNNKFWYYDGTKLTYANNNGYDAYLIPIRKTDAVIKFKSTPYAFITDASGTVLAGSNNTIVGSFDLSQLTAPAYLNYSHQKERQGQNHVSYDTDETLQINSLVGLEVKEISYIESFNAADGSMFTWRNEAISAFDGSDMPNRSDRLRMNEAIPTWIGEIDLTGYQYGLFAFQKDGTYVGWWNGEEWSQQTLVWTNDKVTLADKIIKDNYNLYIVVRYSNNSAITSEDALNFKYLNRFQTYLNDREKPYVNYSVDSVFNKTAVKLEKQGTLTYVQAFLKYNGKYYSTDGEHIGVQNADFSSVQNVEISTGHGNGFCLGSGNKGYISGWSDSNIYVIDLDTITLENTIHLPINGYTTAVVDDLKGIAYVFHRETYPSTKERYMLTAYDYVNESILYTVQTSVPYAAMQSCDIYRDRIIALYGTGIEEKPNGYIVYNTKGEILGEYVLGDFSALEPEGVFIDRETHELLISYVDKTVYLIK